MAKPNLRLYCLFQGCNKAYKAKRSLQLHQLTYHPELVNKPPPHQPGAGVSLCTSSLLREALESRIKQDLTNYSGPHLDETTGEFIEDADGQEVNHVAEPPEKDREKEPVSMIGALLSKTVDMPTVHKIAYAAEGQKYDEEESAEKLSNRTCNICGKVCSKPCDLKRHILMHTGERPYKCEVGTVSNDMPPPGMIFAKKLIDIDKVDFSSIQTPRRIDQTLTYFSYR